MPIEIRRITTPEELTAVYRQRYAIYVEELKYPQRYANHVTQMVVEPLDIYAHILGAFEDGVLVGSARINFGSEGALGDYVDLYGMRAFGSYFPERLSICTKFIVAPTHRAGMTGIELSKGCYRHGTAHPSGNVFNLIDSRPPRDRYFRRLGYRQVRPSIMHPDAGEVVPLVLPIFDTRHLESINSPFAKLLPSVRDYGSVRWFYETFGEELAQHDLRQPFLEGLAFRSGGVGRFSSVRQQLVPEIT